MKYKGVCVFANVRTGGTLLTEMLANSIKTKFNINTQNFYELFGSHKIFLPNQKQLLFKMPAGMITRPLYNNKPFHTPIDLDRLNFLEKTLNDGKIFPVFKIITAEITHHNHSKVKELIIENDEIYKVFLNRYDVVHLILSYFIAQSTNHWHAYINGKERVINDKKMTVDESFLQNLCAAIAMHYIWHMENARTSCNKIVWYENILTTDFNELDILSSDLVPTQNKLNNDHFSIGKEVIENYDLVLKYAKMTEKHITDVRKLLYEN